MASSDEWQVLELVIDNYRGNRNLAIRSRRPTLTEVTQAVKSLNGGAKSSLCLLGSDVSVLCVGGGGTYDYHVSVTLTDRVMVLRDPTRPADRQVDVIIGSIRTPLQADFLVDQRTAMTAVESYFRAGTLEPTLDWVES